MNYKERFNNLFSGKPVDMITSNHIQLVVVDDYQKDVVLLF